MVFFDRFPKNGFTSLTKKRNQDFEVLGLNCFLQTDLVKIAGTVLFYCWMMNHALKKTGIRRVLCNL